MQFPIHSILGKANQKCKTKCHKVCMHERNATLLSRNLRVPFVLSITVWNL